MDDDYLEPIPSCPKLPNTPVPFRELDSQDTSDIAPNVHPDFISILKSDKKYTSKSFCLLLLFVGFLTITTVFIVTIPLFLETENDWGEWSKWTTCDKTCDFGKQARGRICKTTGCHGNNTETRLCIEAPCPDWGPWSWWGSCNAGCGRGRRSRVRKSCTGKQGSSDGCQSNKQSKDCYTKCLDCSHVYRKTNISGVYRLHPSGSSGFDAYCDQGWTTIMYRFDGSQDFYLYWDDYKKGFGNKSAEHWLGNENIHYITRQGNQKMRLEFTYWGFNHSYFASYSYFRVSKEARNYTLSVSKYEGNTRFNALAYSNLQAFSTRDRDNDKDDNGSCAQARKGGFWYKKCANVNPTGLYKGILGSSPHDCMYWFDGFFHCLSMMLMKVKPQ